MITYCNNSDTLILVLHEIYGVNNHMEQVCASWDKQGFDVLCPNLLNRKHFDYSQEQDAYRNFIDCIGFVQPSKLVLDILQEHRHRYKKQIIIGYSVGATIAWLCSENKGLCDGIIGLYGSRIRSYMEITPECPVLLLFPEEEESFHVDVIVDELNRKENVKLIKLDGKHGFANPYYDNYVESSWKVSNQEMANFINELLTKGD